MDQLNTIHITSVDALRKNSVAWDDLWWRSDAALPPARAELLAQWVEHFRPRADFHAVVVARAGRWIAALPLVSSRVGWLISAGSLPGNDWSPCGELLCDVTNEPDAALDVLLSSVSRLPWQMLWLNETAPETPRWQSLLRACQRAELPAAYHERYRVGRVDIDGNWNLYQKRLPKNHRQAMNRAAKRLECEGEVKLEVNSRLDPAKVEHWLTEAFEVEDLGWKGIGGSSVFRTPGMFRFFLAQAGQLARWGQLETAALRLDGRILAFIYGFRAKGVFFAHKIGYDPRMSAFSPGQLLFYRLLEHLHADGQTHALDFVGPLTHSLSRWRPATYGVGRIVLAQRPLGRAAMYVYRHVWRRLRQGTDTAPEALAEPVAHDAEHDAALPAVDSPVVLEPAGK